jgi:hypothetical protein
MLRMTAARPQQNLPTYRVQPTTKVEMAVNFKTAEQPARRCFEPRARPWASGAISRPAENLADGFGPCLKQQAQQSRSIAAPSGRPVCPEAARTL